MMAEDPPQQEQTLQSQGSRPNLNGDGMPKAKSLVEDISEEIQRGPDFPRYDTEVLLGITIAFAQIPESIAFAYMARVKPPVALHAAWIVGLICSLFGGRPGMVNGATGAFAAIIGTFIPAEGYIQGQNGKGVELLFPSVILAGYLMLLVSVTKLSRFIALLPGSVMIGFCNGLAIVIGNAQLHPFDHKEGKELHAMLLITLVCMIIMEYLPLVTSKLPGCLATVLTSIPSSLVAILAGVLLNWALFKFGAIDQQTDSVGDSFEFSSETAYPMPFWSATGDAGVAQYPNLKDIFTSAGLMQIATQGFLLCLVGTIESLMTSEVVESYVKTPSDGNQTVLAMGVANIISGIFGGMGGNAMIGLSTINCLNGGKGRCSPTVTAMMILICMVGFSPILNFIPTAALAGIMLVVVIHTFKWQSVGMVIAAILPLSVRESCFGGFFKQKVPRIEVFVIVVVTILCKVSNIAVAVIAGAAICTYGYAWRSARTFNWVVSYDETTDTKYYDIRGPLFFGSANLFTKVLNPDKDPQTVIVRFEDNSQIMDYSSLEAMHKVSTSYLAAGKKIRFEKLAAKSVKMAEKASFLLREFEYSTKEVKTVKPGSVNPLPEDSSSFMQRRAEQSRREPAV